MLRGERSIHPSDLVFPKPPLATSIVRRLRRDTPLALLDASIVFAAYLVALVLRFDGRVPHLYWRHFRLFVLSAVVVYLLAHTIFGLYGRMWRYASVQEARQLVLASVLAGAVVVGLSQALGRTIRLIPLSAMILGATLSLMGFGAIRFQSRLFGFRRRTSGEQDHSRVLLVGAGRAGAMVLKDILAHPSVGLRPVGVVDDDRRKIGRTLFGVPVLGTRGLIPVIVDRLQVDQVLLAISSATSDTVQNIAALCQEAKVPLKILPSVREIVGGRVTVRDIRDLRIEDLLGRQQVETDLDAVRAIIQGRRVLVTGGGGSIGSEIARQVADFDPSALLLLDHDETHLHEALADLDGAEGSLVDVRDADRIFYTFLRYRPQVVFHAAAHKHVPVLETSPEEAVLTNILGTANLTDAALATGVEQFVLISTDKAVRPASVMGASKWFAEQIVRSYPESSCVFCAVRFGNVLGSRGSVIPTFLHQIAKGGPVTVTDTNMTRYFMSVQEAVLLVLQAAALSRGGEVFTLDMGEAINILHLAENLIRLSGRVPGRDVGIEIVGTRPGEKLVEDLVSPDEHPVPSPHPSIVVSHPPVPEQLTLRRSLRDLEALAKEGRSDELAARMKEASAGARDVAAAAGAS
jgi:FlaA1/EpsC-like NDP-sugar epimerase